MYLIRTSKLKFPKYLKSFVGYYYKNTLVNFFQTIKLLVQLSSLFSVKTIMIQNLLGFWLNTKYGGGGRERELKSLSGLKKTSNFRTARTLYTKLEQHEQFSVK